MNFSSTASSDPDGSIASRLWNFGDGSTSTATSPSHTYTSAGLYAATLTITDNRGATASTNINLSVVAPAGAMRVTDITLSAVQRFGVVSVTGAVTVRNANNLAVSGAAVNITWTRPGASTRTQTATTDSNGVARFTTSGKRGTYTLRVNNVTKTGSTFDSAGSVLTKSITR